MLDTDSALPDLIAAPVLVAEFHTRPALYDKLFAPFLAAAFVFAFPRAPVLAKALHSRPMLETDSALLDLIAAPFFVAVFAFTRTPLLVMPHA
jgi:hypothetical protein